MSTSLSGDPIIDKHLVILLAFSYQLHSAAVFKIFRYGVSKQDEAFNAEICDIYCL